jgi:hypothetical protein
MYVDGCRYNEYRCDERRRHNDEEPQVSTHLRGMVYYESIKREIQRRPKYEFRCDERLKTKVEGSTRLVYTGLIGGLEHLKIETRLIDERFVSVMVECVLQLFIMKR